MSDKHDKSSLPPEELREILDLLRQTARGERPSAGRDEVPGRARLQVGGMHGRALACLASAGDRESEMLRVVAGAGEIAIRMAPKGEFVYTYGALTIEAPDRARGAAFVEAMADWLGTPLATGRSIALAEPAAPLHGEYVKLAVRDDADGVRWNVFKLVVDGEVPAEVFLRVSTDGTRAAFTEKWSRYRQPLLEGFDRCFGAGRAIAERKSVDVSGGAWLAVPPDWIVTSQAAHVRITDAADEAVLEVSHQPYPLHPQLPGLRERLQAALDDVDGREAAMARAVAVDRGDLELIWTEYEYESTDSKTGGRRLARARILIAANDALQALVTLCYWPADEGWAIPEWETIISTLRLAGRSPDLVPDSSAFTSDRD